MSYRNILVIKLKQPGDVLVSTPVLTALKEAWPEARVTFLVTRAAAEMVEGHPLLDELFLADRHQETWSRSWRLLQTLWQANFDLVLELSGGDRGAFYTLATRARKGSAPNAPGSLSGSARVCSPGLYPAAGHDAHGGAESFSGTGPGGGTPQSPPAVFLG